MFRGVAAARAVANMAAWRADILQRHARGELEAAANEDYTTASESPSPSPTSSAPPGSPTASAAHSSDDESILGTSDACTSSPSDSDSDGYGDSSCSSG